MSDELEAHVPSGAWDVVLAEMRRVGKAVDALSQKLDDKLDEIRTDHSSTRALADRVPAMESALTLLAERVRQLELDGARAGVKLMLLGAIAGLVGTGIVEGALLLIHH